MMQSDHAVPPGQQVEPWASWLQTLTRVQEQ
jgi:hypothetical protein